MTYLLAPVHHFLYIKTMRQPDYDLGLGSFLLSAMDISSTRTCLDLDRQPKSCCVVFLNSWIWFGSSLRHPRRLLSAACSVRCRHTTPDHPPCESTPVAL
jgi:hypothetical protein